MRAVNWLPLRCVRRCWHARQSLSRDALRVTAALLYLSLRCFSLRSRVACHRLHRCRVVRFAIHSHAASSPPPLPREGTPLCSCVSHRRLRRCRVGASRCALAWRIAAAAAAWEHLAALSRGVSPPDAAAQGHPAVLLQVTSPLSPLPCEGHLGSLWCVTSPHCCYRGRRLSIPLRVTSPRAGVCRQCANRELPYLV